MVRKQSIGVKRNIFDKFPVMDNLSFLDLKRKKCPSDMVCIFGLVQLIPPSSPSSYQGWAILEELYFNTIPGGQNCRELVKFVAPENFIGENWSSHQKPKKDMVTPSIFNNRNSVAILVSRKTNKLNQTLFAMFGWI